MKSDLDKELASALAESSDGSDEPVVKSATSHEPAPRPVRAPSKGSRGLLIALVAMGAAIVALVLVGMQSASIYAMNVDQVVGQSTELTGRRLRVDGELVPGTLVKRDKPCEYRFTMHAEDKVLNVRYAKCEIPDTFRDWPEGGVLVTVEGTLASGELFEATNVFAKCSSKYDPATHELTLPDGTKAKAGGAPSAREPVPAGYDTDQIIR